MARDEANARQECVDRRKKALKEAKAAAAQRTKASRCRRRQSDSHNARALRPWTGRPRTRRRSQSATMLMTTLPPLPPPASTQRWCRVVPRRGHFPHRVPVDVRRRLAAALVDPEPLVTAGAHGGPVTAGVFGTERLGLDVFGDCVNTASGVTTAPKCPVDVRRRRDAFARGDAEWHHRWRRRRMGQPALVVSVQSHRLTTTSHCAVCFPFRSDRQIVTFVAACVATHHRSRTPRRAFCVEPGTDAAPTTVVATNPRTPPTPRRFRAPCAVPLHGLPHTNPATTFFDGSP